MHNTIISFSESSCNIIFSLFGRRRRKGTEIVWIIGYQFQLILSFFKFNNKNKIQEISNVIFEWFKCD